MSTIFNQVLTEFRVVGTGVQAGMQQLVGGTTQWTRSIQDATRQSEKLSALWRAFGTTLRYAIAGQVVFGMGRFITQLKEVQVQMGLISAIGELQGGQPIVGQNLTNLMRDIRVGAVESLTPVQQYNDAVINLLSTIQNVPQDQITPMVTTITRAAQLAQVGAEDATRAFTTLGVAFGQRPTPESIQTMAQEFFILTKQAPGGVPAGQQMLQQMGQLAALTRAAHGTPPEMFALMLSGLRGGIPPAQAGRALQFFLQTLAFPGQQVAPSRKALASVGITPLSNMTLQERLNAIFKRAGAMGVRGDLGQVMNLDEETMAGLEGMDATSALQQVGISGPGAVFLGTVFRRIHALRMALALSTQVQMGQFDQDMKMMQDAHEGIVSDTNDMAKAWERLADQAPLQAAATALDALRVQISQDLLAPVLKPVAKTLVRGVGVAQEHPDETRNLLIAALLGGGAIGGFKFFKGLGRTGVPLAAAAQSIMSGDRQLGTLLNPMYVIIVSDMSTIFNPGGRYGPPRPYGPRPRPEGDLPGDRPRTTRTGRAGRFGRIFRPVASVGGALLSWPAAVAAGGTELAAQMGGGRWGPGPISDPLGFLWSSSGQVGREWRNAWRDSGVVRPALEQIFNFGGSKNKLSFDQAVAIKKAQQAGMPEDQLRRMAFGMARSSDPDIQASGRPNELTLNINLKHPDGTKSRKKVHLPITQYQNGKAPSQGGSAAKSRK